MDVRNLKVRPRGSQISLPAIALGNFGPFEDKVRSQKPTLAELEIWEQSCLG